MELKVYLRILLRRWWVALLAFLVTFVAATGFTLSQAPTYTCTATFLVTPNASFDDAGSFATGLDILGRRSEIATTYAEVANSRLIRQEAAAKLGLSLDQIENYSVASRLRAGTNVLEITIEGSNPVVVRDLVNAIGARLMIHVRDLYEAFEVRPLDEAILPRYPIKPNRVLNLILGAGFGLALGLGLAFLVEYLQTPLESMADIGIYDPVTAVYNKRYFTQRLGEEMSRARRNKYPLSLALMNVDQLDVLRSSFSSQTRSDALRKVAVFLKQYLREEDMMAWFDGTTFAFLLPDLPKEEATAMMERLQARLAWTPFEMERTGVKLNLSGAAGVVDYQGNGTRQDELVTRAEQALKEAEAAGYGKVTSGASSPRED